MSSQFDQMNLVLFESLDNITIGLEPILLRIKRYQLLTWLVLPSFTEFFIELVPFTFAGLTHNIFDQLFDFFKKKDHPIF